MDNSNIQNNALVPNVSNTGMASTNPTSNVSTAQIQSGKSTNGIASPTVSPVAKQSTTTISNTNKINQVPAIQATTNQYAQGGVTTDPNSGTSITANGTAYIPYTPPESTPSSDTGITSTGGYVGETYYAPGSQLPTGNDGAYLSTTATSPSQDTILKSLNDQKVSSDALTAEMVQNVEDQYKTLVSNQQQVNAGANAASQGALFRSGAAQGDAYAQNQQNYQIQQGVSALADLATKKQTAILAAKQAGQTQDFQLQDKINQQIDSIAKDQAAAGQKVSDAIMAAQTKANDAKIQATKDTTMSDLYSKGVTDPATMLQKLKSQGIDSSLKEVSDNIALLSGVGGTGAIGDYNLYKAQTLQKGLTPVDYMTFKDQQDAKDAKQKADDAYATAYNSEKGKDAAGGGSDSDTNQQKLEQQGRQVIAKEFSARTGALGIENAKVDQANHLNSLFQQYYDPKTGNYNIPSNQYNEVAIGLANLVSSGGSAGETTIANINAATAKGDINKAIQYATGAPQNGNTQAMIKNALDSIDRQAMTAVRNRQAALDNMTDLLPTDLDQDRKDALIKATQMVKYEGEDRVAKSSVDQFTKAHPEHGDDIAKLYEVPGATDSDVLDYINQTWNK